jgi:dTDP-4-dehydrorhamnose reductase
VHTIRRLARERSVLRVVADQHGCPTWTDDLAGALLALAALPSLEATYHACNAGPTTWFDFAKRITNIEIQPITTADYPTPARRPRYSVLDTSRLRAAGIELPSWEHGLAEVLRS